MVRGMVIARGVCCEGRFVARRVRSTVRFVPRRFYVTAASNSAEQLECQRQMESWRLETEGRVQEEAIAAKLFASPRDAERCFPAATLGIMFLSGACSLYLSGYLWEYSVVARGAAADSTMEHVHASVETFVLTLDTLARNPVSAALCRLEEKRISFVLGGCFFLLGTFLERLKGSFWVLGVWVAATLSGRLATEGLRLATEKVRTGGHASPFGREVGKLLDTAPPISTNAGTLAFGGYVWRKRLGKCAIWPGVFVPLGWACAPLLVFEMIQWRDYLAKLVHQSSSSPGGEAKGDGVLPSYEKAQYDRFLLVQHLKTACDRVRDRRFHRNQPPEPGIENFTLAPEDEVSPPRIDDTSCLVDLVGFAAGIAAACVS